MAIHHDQDSALAKAIRKVGSQTAFGNLLGKRQSVVSGWLLRGTPLPAEHVLAIEAATGISRHDLRPDIYPIDLPASPSPSSDPQGNPIPEGRTSSFPDADLDPVEASTTVAGGEAARSEDDPGRAADTPPIGKAAA